MFTKKEKEYYGMFGLSVIKTYYKDGRLYGKIYGDGEKVLFKRHDAENTAYITRDQAYRYWRKHFNGLPCWLLPPILEKATDLDPNDCDKNCFPKKAIGKNLEIVYYY